MGDLDDAIREHLELKRLHGADPHEVARLEHEALGAVPRGEDAAFALPVEPEPHLRATSEEAVHATYEHVAPLPAAYESAPLPAYERAAHYANGEIAAAVDNGEATQEFHIEVEERWADESADHAGRLEHR
ncbi:MAG: hypothetical protein ABSG64_07210 [Solirubrobacteraceae bacterium]|jgi:hypothetical protein